MRYYIEGYRITKMKQPIFYRRKVLLAFLEAFGGNLKPTDCQKLVFLLCQNTPEKHYDFFPYKFGGFSHVLYYDKRLLTQQGLLDDTKNFSLRQTGSFANKLRKTDLSAIHELAKDYKGIYGKKLLKQVYRGYPYYACRSEVLKEVLEADEIRLVEDATPKETKKCVFTLGYEGVSIDSYLNELIENNVKLLIDVRKNPFSRKFGFSKNQFKKYLSSADIEYSHIPELGIESSFRQRLTTEQAYAKLFTYYSEKILPDNMPGIKKIENLVNIYGRVALSCFEADHKYCHRSKITDFLDNKSGFDVSIMHLD